ncbi:MAG TPA: hypothetical protein VFG14_12935 [Chthoniobacteraceae bacterium]|nr:hypothetical protein [Chthoniobacteraceae bacterium]
MINSSPPTLSPEEQEQLLQTIEMFEVIVQANPHDCQSLEILKDAYFRLGMKRELMKISRRMAQTYMELGQFATAILEYENILRHEPDDPEIIAAMGDCEERMHKATKASPPSRSGSVGGGTTDGGGLIATSVTQRQELYRSGGSGASGQQDPAFGSAQGASDGNEALAKFLIQHKLAAEEVINASLERVQNINGSVGPSALGISLLEEIVERGGAELDALLSGIVDRTKFAYIPLEYYDVDRHVVRMLSEDLTLKRLIVPFDLMSRTVMIATANPFDSAGKEAAQSVLDYNIQWHVASPQAIARILTQAYRIGSAPPTPRESVEVVQQQKGAPVFGEVSTALPIPELKVSASSKPTSSGSDPKAGSPLPDTSDFRLKK